MNSNRIRWYRLAALTVSLFIFLRTAYSILIDLDQVKGWEAQWVAEALASGQGFSMPNPEPWGYDLVNTGFHSTAWTDPIYTYILAGMLFIFHPSHQVVAATLNLILILTVFGLTYFMGERLISPSAGLICVILLAANRQFSQAATHMNNALFATALIALSVIWLIRFCEEPSNTRAIQLGLMLGMTALGCPSTQFFIFITAIVIVLSGWKNLRTSALHATFVVIMAILLIFPWNLRNYLVFGTYVPIRTGGGWSAFVAIVATAGTFSPEKLNSKVPPPYRTDMVHQAVRQNIKRKIPLDRFLMDYGIDVGGSKFINMNEAERDSWLLEESKKFIKTHPILSARIAVRHMEAFVRTMGLYGILVFFFAGLGALLSIRKPTIRILALWAGAFIAPFLLITCFYNRYRLPIEPVLILLATFALWRIAEFSRSLLRKRNLGTRNLPL